MPGLSTASAGIPLGAVAFFVSLPLLGSMIMKGTDEAQCANLGQGGEPDDELAPTLRFQEELARIRVGLERGRREIGVHSCGVDGRWDTARALRSASNSSYTSGKSGSGRIACNFGLIDILISSSGGQRNKLTCLVC
jgi:hypothetical protein